MPNPFDLAPELPNQAQALAGLPILAETFERTAELVNWLEAYAGCDDSISEEWPDGQARVPATVLPPGPCAVWRIPQSSPLHTIYDVEVRADCSTGDGQVELRWLELGLSVTLNPGPVRGELAGAIHVGAAPAGHWTVEMTIWGGPTNGVTTVESVRVTPRPLASPLPEGVLDLVNGDELVPFGLDALQPDMPLPSVRGRRLRDAIRALRRRPRMRFCRSGLWEVQGTGS